MNGESSVWVQLIPLVTIMLTIVTSFGVVVGLTIYLTKRIDHRVDRHEDHVDKRTTSLENRVTSFHQTFGERMASVESRLQFSSAPSRDAILRDWPGLQARARETESEGTTG